MAEIRAFTDEDIPQVARLHRRVFPRDDQGSAELDSYRDYFARVFFANPSRDAAIPSLVYQEADGRIVGFLGVAVRTMRMNGHRLRAAVSSQFIVDPGGRASLVAVRLAKTFLAGPTGSLDRGRSQRRRPEAVGRTRWADRVVASACTGRAR